MSTGTQPLKRSIPNQWTRSSQLSMSTQAQQQQAQISMSEWAQSLMRSMPNQ